MGLIHMNTMRFGLSLSIGLSTRCAAMLFVLCLFQTPSLAQTQPGGILCSVRGFVDQYVYAPDGNSYSIQLDGRTGYFLHHDDVLDDTELVVVDFTVPLAPVVLGTYPIGNVAYEISLTDGVLYATIDEAGVGIFDVSDPGHVEQVGLVEIEAFNPIYAVVGDRMYVADDSDTLSVVDLGDIANPVVMGELAIGGTPRRIVAEGERVYLAIDTDDLLVIDVSDPTGPVLLETYPYEQSWFPSLAMDSGLIILAGGSRFQVIHANPGDDELELRSETAIYELGDGLGLHRINSIRLDGTDLFIGTGESASMLEISLEDPSAPVLKGLTGITGYDGHDFAVGSQGLVVVSAFDLGLCILDMRRADVSIPFSDEWFAFGQVDNFEYFYTNANALEDGVLYASYETYDFLKEQRRYGVLALDVQDPANPVPIGSYLSDLDVVDFLEVKDHIVYMNRYGDGLEIVDFSTPSEPVLLLHYPAFHDVSNLGLDGDTLWMQVERNEFVLLDVSDPLRVEFKAYYKLDSQGRSNATFHDGLLYISHAIEAGDDETPVVSVVDLADPFRPVRVDHPAPTVFEEIQVSGYKFIGVSTETGQLYITARGVLENYDTAPLLGDEGGGLVVVGDYAYWNAWYDRVFVYDVRAAFHGKLIGAQTPESNEFSIVSDGEQLMLVSSTGVVGVTLDPSCEHCDADLNYDGVLNFFDVAALLVAYSRQDPSIDFTNDGMYNFHDISLFLQLYASGCP